MPGEWQRPALIAALAILVGVCLYNASVATPVAMRLSSDTRDKGIALVAYRTWAVHPHDITIDLIGFDMEKTPADLIRTFFEAAASLKGRKFGTVTLARQGKPVFEMTGTDFLVLGSSFDLGENPAYLIRTLPQSLTKPDGDRAFGTWEGGLIGVLGQQMKDAGAFAVDWVKGTPSVRIDQPAS